MIVRLAAAGLVLAATIAAASDGGAPLTLDAALARTAAVAPDRTLAATRGLPYHYVAAPQLEALPRRAAARLETMARFFEVVLADLDEIALSQRMAIAFVAYERARGQAPDATRTLEGHLAYRELFARRNATRDRQRLARLALGLALGAARPPAELVDPDLPAVAETEEALLAGAPLPTAGKHARRLQARTDAALELRRLLNDERARAAARNALAERRADEARADADAGRPSDLYGAVASGVEARADARAVEFAIALARERLTALARD